MLLSVEEPLLDSSTHTEEYIPVHFSLVLLVDLAQAECFASCSYKTIHHNTCAERKKKTFFEFHTNMTSPPLWFRSRSERSLFLLRCCCCGMGGVISYPCAGLSLMMVRVGCGCMHRSQICLPVLLRLSHSFVTVIQGCGFFFYHRGTVFYSGWSVGCYLVLFMWYPFPYAIVFFLDDFSTRFSRLQPVNFFWSVSTRDQCMVFLGSAPLSLSVWIAWGEQMFRDKLIYQQVLSECALIDLLTACCAFSPTYSCLLYQISLY